MKSIQALTVLFAYFASVSAAVVEQPQEPNMNGTNATSGGASSVGMSNMTNTPANTLERFRFFNAYGYQHCEIKGTDPLCGYFCDIESNYKLGYVPRGRQLLGVYETEESCAQRFGWNDCQDFGTTCYNGCKVVECDRK